MINVRLEPILQNFCDAAKVWFRETDVGTFQLNAKA